MTRVLLTGAGALDGLGIAAPRRLGEDLLRQAGEWAAAVAPDADVPVVGVEDVAQAARTAFADGDGPVLIASAAAPRLSGEHARMALADLEEGVAATFGPGIDGGWYLVGLAAPHESLLDLLGEAVAGAEVMGRLLGAAAEADLEVGLLRMERLLRTTRDAAALRADPLTPRAVRTALRVMG